MDASTLFSQPGSFARMWPPPLPLFTETQLCACTEVEIHSNMVAPGNWTDPECHQMGPTLPLQCLPLLHNHLQWTLCTDLGLLAVAWSCLLMDDKTTCLACHWHRTLASSDHWIVWHLHPRDSSIPACPVSGQAFISILQTVYWAYSQNQPTNRQQCKGKPLFMKLKIFCEVTS